MDLNLQKKVKKLNNCLFERDLNHLKTYKYKKKVPIPMSGLRPVCKIG